MIAFRLLGQFGIRRDGQPVELASRPAQSLLAYLLLNAGIEYRREKLAGVIWPDATEDNARTYLRQALWRIRKAIGADYLLADRVTVGFNARANYWLDVDSLERSTDIGWTAGNLEETLDVYKGELLPGFYEDWVVLERERLQNVFEGRVSQLLDRLIEESQWKNVLHWGERWIALGHAPEPAYRALMMAYAGLGDLAGMANAHHRCVQALEEDLGVEPSEKTRRLYRDLSAGKRPVVSESGSELRPETITSSSRSAMDQSLSPPAFLSADQPQFHRPEEPFIGREQELITLEKYLQQALEGQGRVVFVTGEAGQGKTTLLREFARRAQETHPDLIVATGACPVYTPVCAPYGLFREVLEMLTGDVESAWAAGTISRDQALRLWALLPETIDCILQQGPHLVEALVSIEGLLARARSASVGSEVLERLNTIRSHSMDGSGRLSTQGDLFAEYVDFLIDLSKRQPLLLILDDLHWADSSSIGLLGHLGHRLSEGAILIAGAYRPEEVNQGREDQPHPLVPVLGEYKRHFGRVLVTLDDAEAGGGRSFIDGLLDVEANALGEEFRQGLTRHTNGHPLFTIELLREMQERGALQRDEAGRWVVGPDFEWDVVPPRVEGVIETRISHLDQELGQWLELASVEGEAFTAEVIAQALDLKARVVVNRLSHELDRGYRLVRAQGVRQAGSKRMSLYHFRHSLFRQYLYQQLDDIERSYLHQQVGETLEQLYEGRTDEIADQLAHHFQMAGLAEKSMIYLVQAGDIATHVYAYDEAKDFYEQALTLAKQLNQTGRNVDELIGLYTKLGRILEHNSDTEGALSVYREMEELGRSRSNQPMILEALAAQCTLYSIPSPVHDPKQGQAISEQALTLAQELGDRAAEARIQWSLMIAYEYDNQSEKAIEFGERSLALARDLELHQQLAFILGDLGGCYWIVGKITRAKELFREATEIRRKSRNLPMLADVLIQSSFASMFGGDYDEAIALSDEAWQISQSIGNKWNLAFSRSRIGFTHRARGELGLSVKVAEKSLRLGETQDLPNPQIFAGAELAFDYAYLGATDLGLKTTRSALNVADEKVPSYRPYLLAALAENLLVNGDLDQAEAAIHQARSDPHWQAFPVLCIALILADVRLAMARADYDQTLQLADELLNQLRRFGIRSYLPEVLDLSGQALLELGRVEEARSRFMEARLEAESMGAMGNLWPILFHLSQLETELEEAARLRQEARELIEFIANHTGRPSFRESFLALSEVRAVIESTE